MVKVSVVLTVYNGEPYLRECINSILAQTLDNIEIICVNDASTDSTSEILDEYADRIMVLTNEHNLMAGESRNYGFTKAQGEYVIFLDADDVFKPDMLKKAYQKAQAVSADVCIFKESLFSDESERYMGYPYAERIMEILGERNFFSPAEVSGMIFNLWNGWAWDKIFRRQFLLEKKLKFSNIKTSEDGFLVHAALASAKRIAFINEELVHHRIGNANSVSNTRSAAWRSCFIYLRELKEYLTCNGLLELYERSFVNWACEFLCWNYQTIHEELRLLFFLELRRYMLYELNAERYEITYFYNAFSFQFIQCVILNDSIHIPISEQGKILATYWINERKIEELRLYFFENNWEIALWGAGIRGLAFMETYATQWNMIRCIYDMDKRKQGNNLYPNTPIKPFDVNQVRNINCILVLNAAHISEVKEVLKGSFIAVFDLNSYLTLPQKIEECFV